MRMSELDLLRQAHGYTLADMAKPKAMISYAPSGCHRAETLVICDSLSEAEDLIAVYEQVDPDGVRWGHYGVDWPCTLT